MEQPELIPYDEFKTGLTFKDVRKILKLEQAKKYAAGEYMFVTRRTVLGRWHEIKLRMYADEEAAYDEYLLNNTDTPAPVADVDFI